MTELAQLFDLFRTLRAMSVAALPELAGFEDAPVFRVVAWATAHDYARMQLRVIADPESRAVYATQLEDPDRVIVLGHRESSAAEDVDTIVAIMCEELPGAALTLMVPGGVALRLNRRARRAALARARRAL